MKRFGWRWFAVSSIVLAALAAQAERRPQYGGVLRLTTHEALASLDPAQTDSFARRGLIRLMFDTLVVMDENGRPQPSLATTWQTSGDRWEFRLRRGVKFQDGTPLTAEVAAASLRAANPAWNVSVAGDSVVINWDRANPTLLAELSLPHNAIATRTSDRPSGTGPFHIVDWQPGKKLTLAAEENCWSGRPFLDGIEIEMGKSVRDQLTALELGRADLMEVAPEQAHRIAQEGRGFTSSAPIELIALVFSRDAASPDEKLLRQALGSSVERASIRNVLLQGTGQATSAILPNWMSGYAFVFPTDADLARARQLRQQVRNIPTWTLGYDGADPLARFIAERIALNARDAGVVLQPSAQDAGELRLARIPLVSADPWIALSDAATMVGLIPEKREGTVEELYASEMSLLATQRIIPLFHLPAAYASTTSLQGWTVRPDGSWALSDAWLTTAR